MTLTLSASFAKEDTTQNLKKEEAKKAQKRGFDSDNLEYESFNSQNTFESSDPNVTPNFNNYEQSLPFHYNNKDFAQTFNAHNIHNHNQFRSQPGHGTTKEGTTDLGTTIQFVTKKISVPVPKPYPVKVVKRIPVPKTVPVPILVARPYPVTYPKPVPITVEKRVPFTVERKVPYPVKVPIRVPVKVAVPVPVPQPYPVTVHNKVPVSVPHPVVVKNTVPVFIKDDKQGWNTNQEEWQSQGNLQHLTTGVDFGNLDEDANVEQSDKKWE